MTAEVLRRAVQGEVGTLLERAQVDGSGRRRVDDDACRVGDRGLEIGHGQERIGRRLEPDEVDAVGRRTRLVELDEPNAPGLERAEEHSGPVVGTLGQRDGLPRLEQAEDERGGRPGAGGIHERLAALELRERALGRDRVRMAVALVVERARLAVAVRPDRRAVERLHDRQL
jgi:hypothetical protein